MIWISGAPGSAGDHVWTQGMPRHSSTSPTRRPANGSWSSIPRLLVLFGALIMLIHVDSIYSQVIRCLSKVIGAISLTFHTWACKTSWLLTVAKQHCGRCSYRVISHDLMCGIFGSWHFPQECSEMVRFSYCPFSTSLWPLHPFTVNQTSKTIGNGCSIWVITTGDKMNWD